MDRFLYTDRGAAVKRIADVYLMFTAGTAGAIPTTLTYAEYIESVTLDSTGVITVNLQDAYVDCIGCEGNIEQASDSAATARYVVPADTTDVGDATAPKVVVNLIAGDDGALADMAVGDIFRLHLTLIH